MESKILDQLLVVNKDDEVEVSKEVGKKIKNFLNKKKELEAQEKELKELFFKEMEARNLKKVSSHGITVTYIAPTKTEKFNKDKFKTENEKLYNKYVSFENKKGYVKIEIKE